MTEREKQIRKAYLKVKAESAGMKEIWKDIRKDHKIDRHNAVLDLVCAGIELKEAREIVDKQIREEEAMFRSEAYNEITRRQKLMIKELGLGE